MVVSPLMKDQVAHSFAGQTLSPCVSVWLARLALYSRGLSDFQLSSDRVRKDLYTSPESLFTGKTWRGDSARTPTRLERIT